MARRCPELGVALAWPPGAGRGIGIARRSNSRRVRAEQSPPECGRSSRRRVRAVLSGRARCGHDGQVQVVPDGRAWWRVFPSHMRCWMRYMLFKAPLSCIDTLLDSVSTCRGLSVAPAPFPTNDPNANDYPAQPQTRRLVIIPASMPRAASGPLETIRCDGYLPL